MAAAGWLEFQSAHSMSLPSWLQCIAGFLPFGSRVTEPIFRYHGCYAYDSFLAEKDCSVTDIQPVPAATVVVVRDSQASEGIEVLLLRRNSKLVFHGGHWVFPGGRIDQADFDAAEQGYEYSAAQLAAVRETEEEAGIQIAVEQLIHTAHWTTPPKLPRRFCTWFFVCPLREAVEVNVDNDEILDYQWLSPGEALAEAAAENLVLPGPTRATLEDIVQHETLDDLVGAVTTGDIRVFPKDSVYYRPDEMGCP